VRTVALLTDFGTSDVFVGVMKGVIQARAPNAALVDLTHDIPPGDVSAAALRLWQAAPYMPPGTIYLAVVDPGVGSPRRAVAAATSSFACVGPDNGIFSWLLGRRPDAEAVQIPLPPSASGTFHGRDVFAPAAARLSAGAPLATLGSRISGLEMLPFPRLAFETGAVRGEVLLSDRFGNLLTSIGVASWADRLLRVDPWVPGCPDIRLEGAKFEVRLSGGRSVALARTFSDVPPGSLVAYIGSDGLLEIGVNRGNAAASLGLTRGDEVILSTISAS
jgi:S-adenosyl-L-methionine hydrolase (adenosine-forming)